MQLFHLELGKEIFQTFKKKTTILDLGNIMFDLDLILM